MIEKHQTGSQEKCALLVTSCPSHSAPLQLHFFSQLNEDIRVENLLFKAMVLVIKEKSLKGKNCNDLFMSYIFYFYVKRKPNKKGIYNHNPLN